MIPVSSWRAKTALLIALSLTSSSIAPFTLSTTPAFAQRIIAQSQVVVPAGTTIAVEYTETKNADKIVVTPTETAPLSLTVKTDVKAPMGAILIPAGSTVKGQLQPANGGTQYVATEIILPNNGKKLAVNATSQVVTRQETIRKGAKTTTILAGTVAGAGAAAALSGIIGGGKSITPLRVLAGAGVGTAAGAVLGRRKVDVIVVKPNEDLTLTLQSNLVITYP
jgi:hypothetical protein